MYGRKGVWAGPELSTGRKASGGKTLDFDAGCTTLVFAVHTAALAAKLLQPQRGNLSGALSYPAGFWESCQRDHSDLPQSAAAGAGLGGHRSPRQPADVRSTAADELRILGRRLGSSFMLSNAAVLLQHKPGARGGRRESSDCLPASPATVADAPDSLGRRRGPMHHLLERRRRRGPEPQGMLAAVAEDAVDP